MNVAIYEVNTDLLLWQPDRRRLMSYNMARLAVVGIGGNEPGSIGRAAADIIPGAFEAGCGPSSNFYSLSSQRFRTN
jgi:hypothetical protein